MRRGVWIALVLALCPFWAQAEPLFYSSVTSNNIDYIRNSDPDAFACLVDRGRARMEMPDKRGGPLFAENVQVFEARFLDGAQVGIWAHPSIGNREAALKIARPVAHAVGKLPDFMRARLDHVVLHSGDETAFGEAEGHFFVLYARNVTKRIRTNDLAETVFHESVHATLDNRHLRDPAWRRAQKADGGFLTGYAAARPQKEDLAETMLIAYTALRYPGRLPAKVERMLRERTPNRFQYISELLAKSDKTMPRRSKAALCP